jgi:hypothetical protein
MRLLSESELVSLWEKAVKATPGERTTLLLQTAMPGLDPAEVTVTQRDRLLLQFKAMNCGPVLDCLTACPACRDQLSFTVSVADLLAGEVPRDSAITFDYEAYEVDARLPTCADLAALGTEGTAHDLARRCLTKVRQGDTTIDPSLAPVTLLEAFDAQLALRDSDPGSTLVLNCPGCGHRWQQELDPPRFLWAEVEARVARILGEVHRIASIYHWSEAEILGLNPHRRQRYLELVDA